jgi:enolase
MTSNYYKIVKVYGREVLDSRGNPTVEVEVWTEGGSSGKAMVPSGASTGVFEALELRDKKGSRYQGKGVEKAVENVKKKISKIIVGNDCRFQSLLDRKLIDLDGTGDKSSLGANAILGASLAFSKCASNALKIPVYRYIGGLRGYKLPVPMMNIINGGKHAGNELSLQEFLIMPVGANLFKEALRIGVEIYHTLRKILTKRFGVSAINVGDEGGYAPAMRKTEDALKTILDAIEGAGYKPHSEVWIGVDAAASSFYNKKKKIYTVDGLEYERDGVIDFYTSLIKDYRIKSMEDPLDEEDFEGFAQLMKKVGQNVQVVGDDLFVTNIKRLEKGIKQGSANTLLLKVNQIGSLTEALKAAELVYENGWKVVVSHRSGETEDDFIADLAVALGAQMIKTGAPARGERTAKYNRLLRIEDELSGTDIFWGLKLS